MSSQLHHNVKLRINHAGAILKEGEGRTAKISVLAILLVICCWGPGYAIILADIVGISLTSFPNWAFRLVPQACGVSLHHQSYGKLRYGAAVPAYRPPQRHGRRLNPNL